MTEDIIEAVARAICVSEGKDPDFDYNPQGLGGCEPGSDLRWKCYRTSAHAAIRAYEAARGDVVVGKKMPDFKPLHMIALLRHAFLSGRGLTDEQTLSSDDIAAWCAYDPTVLPAYQLWEATASDEPYEGRVINVSPEPDRAMIAASQGER